MTAKATSIFVSTATPCVCRLCLSPNLRIFVLLGSDVLTEMLFVVLTDDFNSLF